jgi:hypothetical protein
MAIPLICQLLIVNVKVGSSSSIFFFDLVFLEKRKLRQSDFQRRRGQTKNISPGFLVRIQMVVTFQLRFL